MGAWVQWAVRALETASSDARIDAEELMAAQLGLPRSRLSMRFEDSILAADALRYAGSVERRRVGEPVAYITGRQGFWSLDLAVNPAVLIPRADTETLVEWALQLMRARAGGIAAGALRIADLGTGSGAIALALAQELRANAAIVATDQSEAALAVARQNAQAAGIERVDFRCGNWFSAFRDGERFDLIVSNPPYIAERDAHLEALRYEPRVALTSGVDGLDAIRHLAGGAFAYLAPQAWLLLEHGHDQGAAVRGLLDEAGFVDVSTRRDFGGNERISAGRLGS
ncbi:protein-(glutamine-N5) methyltransferase, release factor-specific [Panacagrimonas perspica]|nr:protein-(glutamine-N5) methyltransferase, release factor-specific [Panacagrimonas perspica]